MPTDNSNAFSPQDLTRTEDQNRAFPNARGQVVPAIESAPEEPQDWKTPMAEPEGGWQQEGTPLTIQARPKEVNKILNSKHVLSDVDTSDPSNARVFVANFLNSKYSEDKRGIYKDYEGKTKAYGLSGDPVADAKSILDGDTKTHESSQTRIAKDRKVIAEGLERLEPEEGQGFIEKRAKVVGSAGSKVGWSIFRSGQLLSGELFNDRFRDELRAEYDRSAGNKVSASNPIVSREELMDFSSQMVASTEKAFDVDPEYANTMEGAVLSGLTQITAQIATGGLGLPAQMYDEGIQDAEASMGKLYSEMTMLEQAKARQLAGPYALVATGLEALPLGKMFKNLTGTTKEVVSKMNSKGFLKEFGAGFLGEGITESAQKQLLGELGKRVLEDGRDVWNVESLKDLAKEFLVAGTVGGIARGGPVAASKALNKFMDPVEGMSAVDMALAQNVVPEAEFNAYTEEIYGDQTTEEGVPLQELAQKARQGDRKAAEQLVEAVTVEASRGAVEAGLTPAEAEARGKEAAEVADPVEPLVETAIDKEISTKKEELAALEEAEDSTPEDMKKYEELDKEIQTLETKRVEEIVKGKMMTPFTRGIEAEQKRVEQARLDKEDKDLEEQDQVIDLINILTPLSAGSEVRNEANLAEGGPAIIQGWKDAGFSKKEIEVKSKELMTAEGMPNTRLEDVVVRGSQKSTKTDGSPIKSIIKLFKGANPFTVVEEFAHAEYDREIAEGTVTVEQVREWRKAVEELTETPDLRGETDEDIKEWVAEQVKARIYGQRNNLSLPESFLKFLDDIISGFKQILGRAKELQDLEASGQLPTDFLEMLDRQGLVGKPVGTPSTQANAGISEQENIDRVETFSLEYTDPALGYTYSYDKDSDKFKQLIKDGYITTNKTLEDFDGEIIFLHQPDGAFSGQLKHGDEVLVEGQGGVFYPIKFHEGGYFWASTDNAAKKMAADLNKVYKQNNGKIYMALTSAPVEKLLSSTTMANAVMDFFSVKASDPKVKLPEKEVQGAIIEAANASKVQDVYNPDTGKTKSVKVSLGLNLDPNDSYAENVEKIKAMLAPDKSSFEARKLFSVNIANSMAEQIEASPDAKEMLGSFFSTGLNNKYSKIKRGKDGDLSKMSGAGMVQALSDMLSEPLTKPFQQRANQGGYVYAVLEINSKVKPVEAVGMHTSYPMAIQSVDDSKTTVHILQQAPHWSTVFEDPKTGKIVKKNRLKSVYPSSGVSTTGVKANTSENPRYTISPVSAEADVKYVKWLELSSMEGTDEEIIAAGEAAVKAGGTTKTFQKWVSKGEVKKIQATAMSLAKSKMKNTAKSMGYTLNKEENVFEGYGKTKSADITYNADGTPITLSDRFDDTNVDESYSLEVEESMKDVTKRTPEVVEAAAQYGAGKITLDEYNEIVAKADPIEPFTEVPAAATEEEIIGALKKDKVPFVGTENFTRTLSSGDRVGARLDIPAYKDHGVWVASVHEPRSGVSSGGAGAKIGYVPTVRLSNVNFATNPFVAFRIATGQTNKTTIATVEGDWVEQSGGMSEAEAKDVFNDPSWVQVGMNPFRHSYFYDRSRNTGAPVVSAEEVIQVGGLVLAKNPVYAPKNDPRFKIMQGKIKPAALEKAGVSDLDATFSLEPLSEQDADAEATVAAEERQSRTPERQAFIDYQRELRRTQLDNTEEEKEKLQKLLQLATDADEIEALKQAGDEKIIRVVEQKVKQIRKQAAEREDVTESVKALERLINSPEVPMEVRARMRGFGRLAERKTPQGKARWVEQMANKLEAEIDRHYRTRNVRTLRSLLRPFATEYAPNRRKLRERVGEEARADLNFAQRLLNNSEATPPEGMTDERRDELIDIFGDVGNRQSNPTRVKAALEIAGSIAKGGRTSRDDFKEDRRQRNEQVGDLVREEVLNGEEAMGKSQIAAREKQRNVFKKGYDYMRSRLIRGMEGFQQQLNKMDSVKGGILEDLFLPAVYQADQTEKALNHEHVERVNEDFKTVLGTDDKVAASWYKNSHELHDTDIEWIEDRAIGMEKRTISKQQGVALFMQWLDPSLRSTFSNMGINEATIEQVKEFIGEIGVSEAYYFRERYAEMGIKLNAKHMEVEGIPLDMIDGYGGRARRINSVGSRQDDMQMFSTNSSGRPTVKSGSMKERTNSTDYLIFQDAAMDFSAHAKEVNHYISHAELAKNLSAAFLNNARARNAITQKHGSDFYDALKAQVEYIIEGNPIVTNKIHRDMDKLRSNVTKAQLMVKPAILVKQLTSAPAFIEEIGPVAYAKAAASLTRNARKFMPMIWGSEYVKNRMSNSQFADIQQQLDQRDNTLKGLRWDDYAMMNIKWGDIGAVIAGGAPVYVHTYNEAKAANMTNDQAQAKAEEVFGLASERAQQSSAGHAKGAFLREEGIMRTWFMYLTSPLQYQRNINTGIANLVANVFEKKAGRKSDVKKAANQALRAIVVYHVILPQIFQAVASGLVGFTDDEDYIKEQFFAKQRRALYMGNFNSFPVIGALISKAANLVAGTGENFDSSGSPLLDLVQETTADFYKALKNGDSLDAWLDLGESASLVLGIPAKTVKSYYEAFTDISEGNTENPLLRALGWSKWSIFED